MMPPRKVNQPEPRHRGNATSANEKSMTAVRMTTASLTREY
jgi:hypothetical protein